LDTSEVCKFIIAIHYTQGNKLIASVRTIFYLSCFLVVIISNAQSDDAQKTTPDCLSFKNYFFRVYPALKY